jgi:hypothetical protein
VKVKPVFGEIIKRIVQTQNFIVKSKHINTNTIAKQQFVGHPVNILLEVVVNIACIKVELNVEGIMEM